MLWKILLIAFIFIFSSSHAKEEPKKALIITVDELQPEETVARISDLSINDSPPKYQSSESTRILKRAPIDKNLDYILVSPQDLNDLKELQLEGVTIDKPKFLKYPDSSSDESLESPSKYTPYSRAPEGRYVESKYPSRPAPPLSTLDDSSNEKDTGQNSPYKDNDYQSYNSPNVERYKVPILENTPETVGNDGSNKPIDPNPSSYTVPRTYATSNAGTYSGYSGYSPPRNSYTPNLNIYSGNVNYRKPNYEPPPYYGAPKPVISPLLPSHKYPLSYVTEIPNRYSGQSTYDFSKPNTYQNPSTYSRPGPNSYPEYPSYGNSQHKSHTGQTNHEHSRPIDYSKYTGKPNAYIKSAVNEQSKFSSVSDSSSHSNSNPNSYGHLNNYDSPDHKYLKTNSNSSSSSTYSYPGNSYSLSNPSSYSPPLSYSSPSTPHYDSSPGKLYPSSEKYPEEYAYSERPHTYETYDPSKIPSEESENDKDRDYTHQKINKNKYYDSPLIKHISYKDLPNSYKNTHESSYENPDSESGEVAEHDYDGLSKPVSHDAYNHHIPRNKHYNYYPSYEKEDKTMYDTNYKPGYTYEDSHTSGQGSSDPNKHSYDTLKTSYGENYGTSSYEEPVKSHVKYRHLSSKSTYENPLPYKNSYSTSSPLTDAYVENAKYKSSHVYPSNDNVPSKYKTSRNLEYGSRYPITYRKTRHTDSKSPSVSFILDDARSQDNIPNYGKKSKSAITESHTHSNNYDSSEVPDHHSVKKNYSPVRPAPLHDELYPPRYPPLPQRFKGDRNKMYTDEGEGESKHTSESYKSEPSVKSTKSYSPKVYNNVYNRNIFYPSKYHSKRKVNSPSSEEMHPLSETSSEETIEPIVYAKIPAVRYGKPVKDKSLTHMYPSNKSYNTILELYNSNNSTRNRDMLKQKEFIGSQPEYSRLRHKDSYSFPANFVHSFSYKSKAQPINITSKPESHLSLSKAFPQKRVPGIVHRSRNTYPSIKILKKVKGYLPYKASYPKNKPAYDNKPYESTSPEVREKTILVYDLPKSMSSKLSNHPNYEKYSTSESKEQSYPKNEKSNHDAIPGEPGKDYPVLREMPYNKFSCEDKFPGFYADVENRCQVYYQCSEEGRLQSFLCPNGTIFNQLTFVCEWWHNVDCSKSEKYFEKNNQLYKIPHLRTSTSNRKRRVANDYDQINMDNPSRYDATKFYMQENKYFLSDKIVRS